MVEYKREVPKCTVFLVVGALTAHLLVLLGNLSTSGLLRDLGSSSSGWASVGTSLADAMHEDLDPALNAVGETLTASIGAVTQIEQGIDVMLSLSGSTTDSALAGLGINKTATSQELAQMKSQLIAQLRVVASNLVVKVDALIQQFLELLKPALNQVQIWLTTFGSRIQNALEEFGTTMDRVQKIFDAVMQQAGPGAGAGEEDMVYNTYTLFDTDKSGTIMADDIQSVASLYGITALQGNKAKELFETYDADGKGGIDEQEFLLFVNDPSIPGIMATMLRTYSQKLVTVAGAVAGASMRDEAAAAVVEFLSLVCAKNMTKLSWVSHALVNGSLPIKFTADVLKGMAVTVDNPNDLTLVDVGALVTKEMLQMNEGSLTEALKLVADPSFWASEGFDAELQPIVVGRVVNWLTVSRAGVNVVREALDLTGVSGSNLVSEAQARVTAASKRYAAQHAGEKASGDSQLYTANASKALRSALLGGVGAAAQGDTKEADSASSRGVRALPQTLLFTSWLAANASQTADRHFEECFDYSGTSSGSLDSLANRVNRMIKKVKAFIDKMEVYASPKGIDMLTSQAQTFANNATDDILLVVEHHVDTSFSAMQCQINGGGCLNDELHVLDLALDLTGAFTFVSGTLMEMKSVLPVVIDDLKFARKEVSSVSKNIRSVMQVMGLKAPPMFYTISKLYRTLWTLYFVFFTLLTISVLYYGFWASGYCGGPPPSAADESYEGPKNFGDRVRVCFSCCCGCFNRCCMDSNLCFWSVILLFESIVLVLFVVAVVICIIGGVQAFMSAGCSQVYILGDNAVCSTAMSIVKTFLTTFWASTDKVDDICGSEALLTCKLITDKTKTAVLVSIIGGLLSSVLSFQMIVESSVMHERARWRLMFEINEAKKV
mmetsp:Transcript_56517/g.148628  ORF Transcript_56517/g.148628 Transcript_56517/m.148628 type:complete len:892 (-) Transcript_56517:100-2775(-)